MMNEQKWLRRIVFLETVAGVPGMARPFTSRYSSHTNAAVSTLWHASVRTANELLCFESAACRLAVYGQKMLSAQN